MADVIADTRELEKLAKDILAAKRALLGRLAERGTQLLKDEVPKKTGNLKQGVAAPDVDYAAMTALINVSARSGRTGARSGQIIGADGQVKKTVTLKPSPAYDYADTVARGRRAFEAKGTRAAKGGAVVGPGFAKMLIIPVSIAPSNESYLKVGGEIFIFRRSAKAVPANPFDERAATRLQNESTKIADAVLREFV